MLTVHVKTVDLIINNSNKEGRRNGKIKKIPLCLHILLGACVTPMSHKAICNIIIIIIIMRR